MGRNVDILFCHSKRISFFSCEVVRILRFNPPWTDNRYEVRKRTTAKLKSPTQKTLLSILFNAYVCNFESSTFQPQIWAGAIEIISQVKSPTEEILPPNLYTSAVRNKIDVIFFSDPISEFTDSQFVHLP